MAADSAGPTTERPKFFEPTQHTISRRIQIGEDESGDKVLVSELVRKDGMLLEFEKVEKFLEKGFEKQPIQLGEHVYFSEDGNIVYATVAGYPRVNRLAVEDDGTQVIHVSIEPLFRITPDGMKASLAIHPPLPDSCSLMTEDVDELLLEAGITYGLDTEKVAEAKEYVQEGLIEFNTIAIAKGRECGPSEDAYLKFKIEIGPIAGQLLKDGSIDFRERRVMVPVNEGDVLAIKIPAQPGTPGVNIFGEEIEATPGKDIVVKTKGDAEFSSETMEVVATAGGVLSVVQGNTIKVSSRQKIQGDIDFSVGNVESGNCLVITGSVQPGFKVKAEGDIEIGGTVSSASVDGQANVVIKGGITGQKTKISGEGDVDILFVEQGEIRAGGICVVRKQSYYSLVHAGGDIRCKRDSIVVGGEIVSAGSISLGDVGSEKADPSLVAAGVVPERLEQHRRQKVQLIELQENIIQQMQIGRSRKLRRMEREAEELKQQQHRINMIPGSGLYSRAGEGDDPRFTVEEYSAENSIDLRKITIEVFGSILAGTTIQIGNRTLKLDKTITSRLFKLNDNYRRILAVPLGRR